MHERSGDCTDVTVPVPDFRFSYCSLKTAIVIVRYSRCDTTNPQINNFNNRNIKNLFMKMLHSKSLTHFFEFSMMIHSNVNFVDFLNSNSELVRENTLSHSSNEYIRSFFLKLLFIVCCMRDTHSSC